MTVSTTFKFAIVADTAAPTTPGRPTITLSSNKPNLTWTASSDNVGVKGYIIYRSTSSATQGTEVGRSTTTTFRDAICDTPHMVLLGESVRCGRKHEQPLELARGRRTVKRSNVAGLAAVACALAWLAAPVRAEHPGVRARARAARTARDL